MSNQEILIELLLDKFARVDERDDAAISLMDFPSRATLKALYEVGSDTKEDYIILASCGEAIAQIMLALDQLYPEYLEELSPTSFDEAISLIKEMKPEWLSKIR